MRRIVPKPDPATRCPLTVVGGFLGAGKTTLLNRLLATARGRYVVLVNDFGAVNVDAGLVADHDGKTLRLTNGCVCCSLADGFLDTLMRVLAEPQPFDHIVIEASGVGDPAAIAEIALVEPGLVLRGVIVLADAERLPMLAADPRMGDTVARQLRAADILILNKCDLVDAAGLTEARRTLASLCAGMPVIETADAAVPEAIFSLDADLHQPAPRPRMRSADSGHEDLFERILYRRAGTFDRQNLAVVLAEVPASLLRLKGSVRFAGDPRMHLLQMVGRRWSLTPLPAAQDGEIELVGIAAGGSEIEDDLTRVLDRAWYRAPPPARQGETHRCD